MGKNRENSFLAKCSYGFADIYGGGAFVVISTFFTVFLTKALGMSPALAGTIPLIGKVWDAITDPIMGNIVDRTSSRFGAKRFYILVGSIISAITFLLLWTNVGGQSAGGQYAFYVLMYMLFSTGFTIVMVPYNGLLPDMVDDYVKRGSFSGIRTVFSSLGAIIAGLVPTIIIKDNTNASQYFLVAVIFSIIFFVVILLTFLGTWEREKEPVNVPLKKSLVQSFTVYKSFSFKLFICIFLAGQGAADFVTGLAVYYVDDVLNAYSGGRFTIMMGVLLLAQFSGTIIFSIVMPRTSKKFPILVGFPVRILATIALLFFSYEGAPFAIILVLSFIIGLGMAASSVSIYAILSDMADVDELITSISRPGIVSGMATFIRKIATGLSSTIIGLLLMMIGYDETLASEKLRQAASTQAGITQLYVWAPIILMVLTIIFAIIFPMNKREFDIVKKEIARRKGEDSSKATDEEIKVCEKVTGFKYDELWKKENAVRL
ncbi:MAG: MFS transporter [Pseudobutyrivibrio ruminis]|uniref:MFS transporter n=1 Tax=Pseudobutyrivibrio ruminis TaxID=46206 RepID=UPI0026ECB38B|nr:MFS transporter [Pseudobutyrivibrio ruminis]MBE5914571.1 MFS transporter [Pseudobutyrivibrio ruminis]